MKAYVHRPKYSGAFTKNFDGAVKEFETLRSACDLSEMDISKAFPVMLTGAVFSHFSHNYSKQKHSYRELVDAFRSWYSLL